MIKLEIEEYCQDCLDFCPDVIKPERVRTEGGNMTYTDTIVHCKYQKRCSGIKRFLEQRIREAETK